MAMTNVHSVICIMTFSFHLIQVTSGFRSSGLVRVVAGWSSHIHQHCPAVFSNSECSTFGGYYGRRTVSTELYTSPIEHANAINEKKIKQSLADKADFEPLVPNLPKKVVGVIFDMDGTVVKPVINFAEMRRLIYEICDSSADTKGLRGDVLELYDSAFSKEQQKEAKKVFESIEKQAILDMEIMDGVVNLLSLLQKANIKCALLTRNVSSSVEAMQKRMVESSGGSLVANGEYAGKLVFDPAVARDTVAEKTTFRSPLPSKPDPEAIFYICDEWKCNPADIIMIGDCAADDIVAANRAGAASILLQTGEDNDSGRQLEADNLWELNPSTSACSHDEIVALLKRQGIL